MMMVPVVPEAPPGGPATIAVEVLYKHPDDSLTPAVVTLRESDFLVRHENDVQRPEHYPYSAVRQLVLRARPQHIDVRFDAALLAAAAAAANTTAATQSGLARPRAGAGTDMAAAAAEEEEDEGLPAVLQETVPAHAVASRRVRLLVSEMQLLTNELVLRCAAAALVFEPNAPRFDTGDSKITQACLELRTTDAPAHTPPVVDTRPSFAGLVM